MIEATKLIAHHLPYVLTYFCGWRNPNHFKIAVYLHCSGLSLYPAAVTHMKIG
jgi:hypothetical protein